MGEPITISAKDCCEFDNQNYPGFEDAIRKFLQADHTSLIQLSGHKYQQPEGYLAEFNYCSRKWQAGRYIGEALIPTNQGDFKFSIFPRFGYIFLFRLLEEIFNIRFTQSQYETLRQSNDLIIKKIIAFLWLQKLTKANRHGLPKEKKLVRFRGTTVKGKINVRQTIKPYFLNKQIVSEYTEKTIDETIAQILIQAYRILKKDYGLGGFSFPESAIQAIQDLEKNISQTRFISDHEYYAIKYSDIYLSFQPVVLLSWDVIKAKRQAHKNTRKSHYGYAFFIDIAELWEAYLRSLIKKALSTKGWKVYVDEWVAYEDHFFKRKLIPDIIAKKENSILIWDAKYKRMQFQSIDIDRGDFFQIHTYLQYYQGNKRVIGGGLLYPLEVNADTSHNRYSNQLLSEYGNNTCFGIDGIDFSFLEGLQNSYVEARNMIDQAERQFLDRINQALLDNRVLI